MALAKSSKGILLTLSTIVLVVLILAELVTYVYLNINYENLSSFGSLSNSGYRFASALNSSIGVFLHSDLSSALTVLQNYEDVGTVNSVPINNTAYALQSLMLNGTIYGTNEVALLGGQYLGNYTNSIKRQALAQNLNLTITNASLSVYQKSPFSLNVSYSALAFINSSSGLFLYPITATAGIPLNGTADLYTIQNGNNYNLKLSNKYPTAVLVGNVYATMSSGSPFQSAYGTVIVENSLSSCGSIPSKYENNNFILAVPNAISLGGTCGFGGIITYNLQSVVPTVPYLVYASSSNVFNFINNGTALLLNGPGRSLLDISRIKSAIYTGSYFNSTFAPSYLDWAQSNITKRSQSGLFSFNLYNRQVPAFVTANGISYMTANGPFANSIPHLSLSLWFNSRTQLSGSTMTLAGESNTASELGVVEFIGANIVFGSDDSGCGYMHTSPVNSLVLPNTWHNVVAVLNNSNGLIYLDGVMLASNSLKLCGVKNANMLVGRGDTGTKSFNGMITNLQLYGITLSPSQISSLYYDGLEGVPVSNNILGFWPLNGNLNDYSGYGRNGLVGTNVLNYNFLSGYTGDPIYDGSFYSGNATSLVYGVLNCQNLNQCSDATQPHFYLGPASLAVNSNSQISEANALGLGNALVPDVSYFNGNGYAFGHLGLGNYYGGNNRFSLSSWVYLDANANGPVMDVLGCLPTAAACAATPIIDVNKNVIYGWIGASALSYVAPSLNSWYHVVVTYNSLTSTENLYVNGLSANSASETYAGNAGTAEYWATLCGPTCTLPSGVSNTLTGRVGDVQFYSTDLKSQQVSQLYQNDTVFGLSPTDSWRLASGFNGLVNQTVNAANALNQGIFANRNGLCTNANVITNSCGAQITQP